MFADAFLTFISTDLIESFNVGKTMNQMQVIFVVNAIKSDYYFLKIEELKYCFEQAKKGRYGTMFDRIDAAVIFGWIDKYLEERTEMAYIDNIEKQKKNKELKPDIVILKALKSIVEKFPQEERSIDLNLISPEKRERTPEEILVQKLFNEFDSLYLNQPVNKNSPIAIVDYNGKKLTANEFVLMRVEEINANC